MDLTAAKATLNIRMGDSDNFTFTAEEKEEALTEAFNDQYVVKPIWDSSLTFSSTTYQYAKPSGVDIVKDIYIKSDNSTSEPEKISSELWEVVGSNIHFKKGASVIPNGYTLYIKGSTKYDAADTIAETNVKEYVLNLAQLHCLNMLGVKKALKFLKNDTSMAEIVAIKRELERKVSEYRARLPREYEVA